jgi:4-amino-4-deoxy-L-arabinose transferase-like glycosyltransferase
MDTKISSLQQLIKNNIFIICILFLGALLLVYRIADHMVFIGDIGWFYLSARDMITGGQIPLVGIASSHPWLHQGPLWTYLLAIGLKVFHFHPLSGAYLAILFGLGSIFLLYRTAGDFFNERTALITAIITATSPLVIIHARMPYHTAPIPFFTIFLFYAVSKWVGGEIKYFPAILLSLSILYNLELATIIFFIPCVGIFLYGFRKHKPWIKKLYNPHTIGISLVAFLLPLLPILSYDTQHGYPQTIRYAAWIGYKVLTLFGYPELHPDIPGESYLTVVNFFISHLQRLLFLPNGATAVLLLLGSLIWLLYRTYKELKESHGSREIYHYGLLAVFLVISVGGFFAAKTGSEAYLPMLFPFILLSVGVFFAKLTSIPAVKYVVVIFLVILVTGNVTALLNSNYLMAVPGGYGPTFTNRLQIAERIVKEAGRNGYTIRGTGSGSQFRSFTMNYEYLTWWKGHPSMSGSTKLQYTIRETPEKAILEKNTKQM